MLHCAELGFRTWVVREGVASVDEGEDGWGEAKRSMEEAGARVVGIDGVEVGWVRALAATDREKVGKGMLEGEVDGDGDGDVRELGERWVGGIDQRRLALLEEEERALNGKE